VRNYPKFLSAVYASFALAFAGLLLTFSSPARAEILQISGTGFIRHCPCDADPADDAQIENGVLKVESTNVHYFAPVMFPRSGQRVCSFSMIYHDINAADTMVVQLKKRVFVISGNPFATPLVMAGVRSAGGVPDSVRVATQNTIKHPVIDTSDAFYYVELRAPSANLNLIGVQIDVRPNCPV
jgi:hypothetical protein